MHYTNFLIKIALFYSVSLSCLTGQALSNVSRELTLHNIFKDANNNFEAISRTNHPSLPPSNYPSQYPSKYPSPSPSRSHLPSWVPSVVPSQIPSSYPTFPGHKISFQIESSPFEIYLRSLSSNGNISDIAEYAAFFVVSNLDDLFKEKVFPRKNGVVTTFKTQMTFDYFNETDHKNATDVNHHKNATDVNLGKFSLSVKLKKIMQVTYTKTRNDSYFEDAEEGGASFLDTAITTFFDDEDNIAELLEVMQTESPIFYEVETVEYRGVIKSRSVNNASDQVPRTRDGFEDKHTIFIILLVFLVTVSIVTYSHNRNWFSKETEEVSKDRFTKNLDKPLSRWLLKKLNKRLESPFKPYFGGNQVSKEDTYYFKRISHNLPKTLDKYSHLQSWMVTMGCTIDIPVQLNSSSSTLVVHANKMKPPKRQTIQMDVIDDVDDESVEKEEMEKAEFYKGRRMRQLNHWRQCEELYATNSPKQRSYKRYDSQSSEKSRRKRRDPDFY